MQIDVVWIGDSILENWVELSLDTWKHLAKPFKGKVANLGISGAEADFALHGVYDYLSHARLYPKVWVIQLGVNDCFHSEVSGNDLHIESALPLRGDQTSAHSARACFVSCNANEQRDSPKEIFLNIRDLVRLIQRVNCESAVIVSAILPAGEYKEDWSWEKSP